MNTRSDSAFLTEHEAYLAAYTFLEHYYKITKDDYLGTLLGGMCYINSGETADPAMKHEWEEAIARVRSGQVSVKQELTRINDDPLE